MKRTFLCFIFALALHADTVQYESQGIMGPLAIQQFDPSLGSLNSAMFLLYGTFSGSYTINNNGAIAAGYAINWTPTLNASPFAYYLGNPLYVGGWLQPGQTTTVSYLTTNHTEFLSTGNLAAFEGQGTWSINPLVNYTNQNWDFDPHVRLLNTTSEIDFRLDAIYDYTPGADLANSLSVQAVPEPVYFKLLIALMAWLIVRRILKRKRMAKRTL